MEEMIYWTQVHAGATLGTGLVLLLSLVLISLQLGSSRKTHELQGFVQVADWLQREEVRRARRRVYELKEKYHRTWANEDRWEAEKVCHNFDVVGDMLKKRLIRESVLESWGWTIKECWVIVKPMIEWYREDRKFPGLWKNFEWMAEDVYKE